MDPIAFTEMNIKRAPTTTGIYTLYDGAEIIYYGRAAGDGVTLRSRLMDHIAGRDSACTRGAKTFTWEACMNPEARDDALLTAFESAHSGRPRCNVAAG
jgi:excinuclease UvrABC nuclease subunit